MMRALPILLIFLFQISSAQWATVKETTMVFPTYGFDDPDPVARMSNIYPYYRFDSYTQTSTDRAWKVVVLENPYIKVFVAPEMGGKILGAFEKKAGRDFIYFNKVVKFRQIAMRGPWTSGGIEFNFGAIGHAPTTASPVDYALDTSGPDAVCVVGSWDLPSRTYWTVEIVVPPDKAYVETRSTWTNPTELNTSLYHWMNAAADARDDLVFEYPGTAYIGHDGAQFDFPVNPEGTNISFYRNNKKGTNKSFHVLGTYTDFFGARYEKSRTGVIHWSPYTQKPGKKIWQWSQSRDGAIWTDLLTDPARGNSQYVEIQSGLLFNQTVGSSTYTPFKHRFFAPHAVESFPEAWYPIQGIGRVVEANQSGALSVEERAGGLRVGLSAVSPLNDELVVRVGGKEKLRKKLSLSPLESAEFDVNGPIAGNIEVELGTGLLSYSSEDAEARKLSRPQLPNIDFDWESAYGLTTEGLELSRQRLYNDALAKFEASLEREPSFTPALVGLAELYYRRMVYDNAISYASQALANDAYDPGANFVYGIASRRLGRLYDAMDALGLASAQESHRAAATVELAEIAFIRQRADELRRALKAVDELGPRYATVARDLRMLSGVPDIKPNGPLDQFFFANRYVLEPTTANAKALQGSIRNELPHESYLEIALHYASLHLYNEALRVLGLSPSHAMVSLWKSHLQRIAGESAASKQSYDEAMALPMKFVFPHRAEDLGMLLSLEKTHPHWKTQYLIGLLLWNAGRLPEAEAAMRACAMMPDASWFYVARGNLLASSDPEQAGSDYRKAVTLDLKDWRAIRTLALFYRDTGKYKMSLDVLTSARKRFAFGYIMTFELARTLVMNGRPAEAMKELETINILPFEGARFGREVWHQATILTALDFIKKKDWKLAFQVISKAREWPERLGVGRPEIVDERLEDFLEAYTLRASGDAAKADILLARLAAAPFANTSHDVLSALAMKRLGKVNEGAERISDLVRASSSETGYWGKAVFDGSPDVRTGFEKEFASRRAKGKWELVDDDVGFVLVYESVKVLE